MFGESAEHIPSMEVDLSCFGVCVSYSGTGNLVKSDGKMNALLYQNIWNNTEATSGAHMNFSI